MNASGHPVGSLLRLFAGPAIWFAHFVTLYGAATLMCATPGVSAHVMVWIAAAATILALSGVGILIAREGWVVTRDVAGAERSAATFLSAGTILLALIAGTAAIWTALPVAISAGLLAARRVRGREPTFQGMVVGRGGSRRTRS